MVSFCLFLAFETTLEQGNNYEKKLFYSTFATVSYYDRGGVDRSAVLLLSSDGHALKIHDGQVVVPLRKTRCDDFVYATNFDQHVLNC